MFPSENDETPVIAPENPQVAALQRELAESRESEKYWAGLARSGGTPKAPVEADPEPEEDDNGEFYDGIENPGVADDSPEKLIDEFASEGVKALSKRGFITAKDAQKIAVDTAVRVTNTLINRTTTKLSTDNEIMGEFPDLKDQNSALFKETARIYQKAVKMDPKAAKTPAALYLAAEAARATLRQRGASDDDEPESDRRQRAASQDSRPRGRGNADLGDDLLSSNQREVIRAMGITEAEFSASKKSQANRPVKR